MDGDVNPAAALLVFKFITKNSAADQGKGTIPTPDHVVLGLSWMCAPQQMKVTFTSIEFRKV
jgi:hypothetical protein